MGGYFLSIGRFSSALALLLAAALLASGCGGGGSDSTVTVKTGSLSKAQFTQRANAICTAARTQFLNEYFTFVKSSKPQTTPAEEESFRVETIEKYLVPSYEKRMLDPIAALGVPAEYASEVTEFLEALKKRLGEIQEEPKKLTNSPYPLNSAAKAAKVAGLAGCAGSFS
jgi:hypothetical protein